MYVYIYSVFSRPPFRRAHEPAGLQAQSTPTVGEEQPRPGARLGAKRGTRALGGSPGRG